jgi:hypothetical protein
VERDRFLWGFLPFLNHGWGEEAWRWGGPFEYSGRIVRTAVGTETWEGSARPGAGALDYFRGTASGEEWVGTEFEHQVAYRRHPDGAVEAWGPGSEMLTNVNTGGRLLLRFVGHLWLDAEGTLSTRSRGVVTGWRRL